MFAIQLSNSFQGWQCMVCGNVTLRWMCSNLFVAEFREDIRITIPAIVGYLKDSDWHVRNAAIEHLSRLTAQGMCQHHSPVDALKPICSRISGGCSDHHSCHCGMSEGI